MYDNVVDNRLNMVENCWRFFVTFSLSFSFSFFFLQNCIVVRHGRLPKRLRPVISHKCDHELQIIYMRDWNWFSVCVINWSEMVVIVRIFALSFQSLNFHQFLLNAITLLVYHSQSNVFLSAMQCSLLLPILGGITTANECVQF